MLIVLYLSTLSSIYLRYVPQIDVKTWGLKLSQKLLSTHHTPRIVTPFFLPKILFSNFEMPTLCQLVFSKQNLALLSSELYVFMNRYDT